MAVSSFVGAYDFSRDFKYEIISGCKSVFPDSQELIALDSEMCPVGS